MIKKSLFLRRADEPQDSKSSPDVEESIRILAYHKWLASTGGTPVNEETTRQFWLEAERELDCAARS